MKKEEFTTNILNQLNVLINEWFDSNTFQDNITKALAKTVLETNVNKVQPMIDIFTDENGDVRTDILMKHLEDVLPEKIEIDLKQYINLPFVPNKILLLSRQDIIKMIKGRD